MWIFIIAIILYIMFRFFRDLEKQKRKIAIEGGMRIKYSTLVNYMLSGHQNFNSKSTLIKRVSL